MSSILLSLSLALLVNASFNLTIDTLAEDKKPADAGFYLLDINSRLSAEAHPFKYKRLSFNSLKLK